ncbi:AAA family ATPase [Azospirillaceae bacterium]
MRLKRVEIENFRAVEYVALDLNPSLTVFHGDNAMGKTSALEAIAVGLRPINEILSNPDVGADDKNNIGDTDRRHQSLFTSIALTSEDNVRWDCSIGYKNNIFTVNSRARTLIGLKELRTKLSSFSNNPENASENFPVFAYYNTDRAVFVTPQRRRDFRSKFLRLDALDRALSEKMDFRTVIEWFHAKENEELRQQRERKDFDYHQNDLEAVRRAICSMIPGSSNPHIELSPLRFMVSLKTDDGTEEKLSLEELSGGYRIMLALVADLARRMAQGNPHLDDPLQSEAIVLIDEVDLHLHPSWQQRVLVDLMRTFPKTQFIVTTHSPQVLSTVRPEHIVRFSRENGEIVVGPASAETYGEESSHVLEAEMGVNSRPPENEFVKLLSDYFDLIDSDEYDSKDAHDLRKKLESLSPRNTGLDRADVNITRREVLKSMESDL